MYPLIMAPYFRHGSETPWGGAMLQELFGKESPDEMTGESLEVSALTGRESMVLNGPQAGRTLDSMIRRWGSDLTGTEGDFPLLIKLLDAKELLSVQVHPDDAYAGANEGGKLDVLEGKRKACEEAVVDVYTSLQDYFPTWVGYNMARCGGCIRACVSMLEKKGGCMEGRFKEPLRKGKPWKMDR